MAENSTLLINCIKGCSVKLHLSLYGDMGSLKSFISMKWHIPIQDILIITPYGTKLKDEDFHSEKSMELLNHLYVFHRKIFSNIKRPVPMSTEISDTSPKGDLRKLSTGDLQEDNELSASEQRKNNLQPSMDDAQISKLLDQIDPLPTMPKLMASPFQDYASESTSRQAQLKSILQTNVGWLKALKIDVTFYFDQLTQFTESQSYYIQSIEVIVNYLQFYCKQVHSLFLEKSRQCEEVIHNEGSKNWKQNYKRLTQLSCVVPQRNFHHLSEYFDLNELNTNNEKIKHLQTELTNSVDELGSNLNESLALGKIVQSNSTTLKSDLVKPFNIDMNLENNLFNNFNEYMKRIEDITAELLNSDENLSTDDTREANLDTTSNENLQILIRNLIPQITIISKSIYSKANDVILIKRNVQKKLVQFFGEITFVQISALDLKKLLVQNVDELLQTLQQKNAVFEYLESFPIVYGNLLVEMVRRKRWISQIVSLTKDKYNASLIDLQNQELDHRTKWLKNMYSAGQCHESMHAENTDVKKISDLLLNTGNKDCEVVIDIINESNFQLNTIENYYTLTEIHIANFCKKLTGLGIAEESVNVLLKDLENTLRFSLNVANDQRKLRSNSSKPESTKEELLTSYKQRIKRLEAQLLVKKLHNTSSWPSGLFNSTMTNMDNLYHSRLHNGQLENVSNSNNYNHQSLNELEKTSLREEQLKKESDALKAENAKLQQELMTLRMKNSDLVIENEGYKESLAISKNAMVSFTTEVETLQNEKIELSNKFKQDLRILLNQNNKNFNDYDELENKFENLNILTKEMQKTTETMETNFNSEKLQLAAEIETFKDQVKAFSNIEQEKAEKDKKYDQLQEKFDSYIKELFNIVLNDIFVLENIGLLLERDVHEDKETLKITRVKGLRKKLDETTVFSAEAQSIEMNSSLVKNLRDLKAKMETGVSENADQSKHEFLQFVQNLYNNDSKLYETSVVKRFKDVEQLAKKLNKENKKIKNHFQENGIVVGDLMVGDLALFLPAKIENDLVNDFSSVNSSMSSIDLGTPPPAPMQTSVSQSSFSAEKSNVTPSAPKNKVWTAFTAFGTARYIVQDLVPIKGEWFIAKISSLQKHTATSFENPYKLDIGAVWYAVGVKPVQRNTIA
ncbi:hypothetical protein ACO0QE_003311 [Hanseniaspora vineae]